MKKFRSLLLMALPLFALALSGCVKYNGRESSNPSERISLTISESSLSLTEGQVHKLRAQVDRSVEIYWESGQDDVVSLDVTTGTEVNLTAVQVGKTTVSAYVNFNSRKYTASCSVTVNRKGSTPVDPEDPDKPDPSDPVIGEPVTTYLVIGENGRYKGEKGQDIAALYLEYAIEFTANVGDALPTSEDVTSVIPNSSFQCWQSYEGDGALTKWDKVPNARGKILYASFGGGSGTNPDEPGPEPQPQGSVTLYFAGFDDGGTATVAHLGINNKFVDGVKQSDGSYKATVQVTGSVSSVNVYLSQGDAKYFHPYSGVKDYNDMYSQVQTGSVSVEFGGTYTIGFTGWEYNNSDWSHAWFNYTFVEGEPAELPPVTPPDPADVITFVFAGIETWGDPTDVHFAIGDSWKQATKQSDGKYKVEFTVESVPSVSCYMHQAGGNKYFHPTKGDGTYDRFYSGIDVGTVTVSKGNTYVLTYTGWDNDHFEIHGNEEHGWFTYTFIQQ